MEITFLGTGNGMPQADRAAPALVVRTKKQALLFDIGGGCLHALCARRLKFQWLAHVVVTGLAPARTAELASLIAAKSGLHLKKKNRDLELLGPAGLGLLVAEQRVRFALGDDESYTLSVNEVSAPLDVEADDMKLRLLPCGDRLAFRVESPAGAIAFWPREGDVPALVELAQKASFLIAETPLPQRHQQPGLLTPATVGSLARRAKAERVVLTGFAPIASRFDLRYSCERTFKGQVIQAADGMSFGVG